MKKTICFMIVISLCLCTFSVFAKGLDEIESGSVILIEQSSGTVLFEKNADAKRPIASVTKVMTALLLMEEIDKGNISYSDLITAGENAEDMGGSQIFLEVGEQMSVDDMLKGLMIASGNDVAVAIGEHIAGDYDSFIALMNKRAKELGMKNTHFVNPHGLPEDNHYSTARDVGIMSRELLEKHPDIKKYTTIWMDTLRGGEFQLANTNKLIATYKYATGLKTGFTTEAGHCLSASAEKDKMALISVILGGPSSEVRFSEARLLLDYGFDNYTLKEKISANDLICEVDLIKGKKERVNGVAKNDYVIMDNKNEKGEISKEIEIIPDIKAPVEKGQKLGVMKIKKGDSVMYELEIVAEEEVKHRNVFDVIKLYFLKWLGVK